MPLIRGGIEMSSSGDKSGRKPSVAAFLFLPQFGRCFESMRHIVPIFIRTIALMFAQSNLISRDHPALRYGYPGVPRYSFSGLMVEAWTALRRGKATPQQWCSYVAVLLLCFTLAGGAARAIATGAFGIGQVAEAQLFSLSTGPTGVTGAPGVGITPIVDPNQPFDFSINNCGYHYITDDNGTDKFQPCTGHDDYAIMVLDKVLRQGTHHMGGYLQNAMQAMMLIYNTGVLVVAGVMLFWAVLAVVIDTAKTGVVGGQRHNMVWAPIRIVFALGLLMPLSNTACGPGVAQPGCVSGFSSGQLMVEKIAEWGSNLGTNAWNKYLQAAVNSQGLSVPVVIDNLSPEIQNYANMWLCRVFYNSYSYAATKNDAEPSGVAANPNSHTVVRVRHEGVDISKGGGTPTWSYSFENKEHSNLCGTVTLPYPSGDPVAMHAMYPNPSPASTAPGAWQPSAWQYGLQLFKDNIIGVDNRGPGGTGTVAAAEPSWHALFDDNGNKEACAGCQPPPGGWAIDPPVPMYMDVLARAWACDFAMHFLIGVDNSTSPPTMGDAISALAESPLFSSTNCGDTSAHNFQESPGAAWGVNPDLRAADQSRILGVKLGTCTDTTIVDANGNNSINRPQTPFPDGRIGKKTNCIQSMTAYYAGMISLSISTALPALRDAFMQEITNSRGWGDMGAWYLRLTEFNMALEWARHPKVTIQPGDLVYTGLNRELTTGATGATIDTEMMKVMHVANEWWKQEGDLASTTDAAGTPAPAVAMNGCRTGASTPQTSGLIECPANINVTNQAWLNRQTSPATIKGGAGQSGAQKTAGGFLAPSSDGPSRFIATVGDFLSAGDKPSWILDILQPGANDVYPMAQLIHIGQTILKMGIAIAVGTAAIPSILGGLGGMAGIGASLALLLSPIAGILSVVSSSMIVGGLTLTYWLPLLPFIRVSFALMGWIVSVLEAVVMVPIAALAHISTEGEGLAGHGRNAWNIWLNILLRPVLTVAGYVGGIMVFNGFIVYFHSALKQDVLNIFSKGDGAINLMELLVITVVYIGGMFTVANASFKLIESIPAAFFKYMPGGSHEQFNDHAEIGALMQRGIASAQQATGSFIDAGGKMGAKIGELSDSHYAPKPGGGMAGKP
jgi:hypothetical protein